MKKIFEELLHILKPDYQIEKATVIKWTSLLFSRTFTEKLIQLFISIQTINRHRFQSTGRCLEAFNLMTGQSAAIIRALLVFN